MDDAAVVCRQLGFTGVERIAVEGEFGPGTGSILLDEVACTGSEQQLENCSANEWRETNCVHSEDTGVVCEATSEEKSISSLFSSPYNLISPPIVIKMKLQLMVGKMTNL